SDFINWTLIGDLSEVVFIVSSLSESKEDSGELYFDLEFDKVSFLQKNFTFLKVGFVFGFGLILALIGLLLNSLFGSRATYSDKKNIDNSFASRFKKDLFYGIVFTFLAVITIGIYFLGTMSSLDGGFSFLLLGLGGALFAELLKFRLTGKHLTAGEVFLNVALTGLLAATASRQVLLQAPASWTQMLLKCNLTAALACLVYHALNAYMLISQGRHIKAATGALIVAVPYFFGWLLILENSVLIQSIGLFSAWPILADILGRLIVVFGFNEAVANSISLATKTRLIKGSKAHLYILLVSLTVVLSPYIADMGSGSVIAGLPLLIRSILGIFTTIFSQAGLWAEVYLITGMILDAAKGIAPSQKNIFDTSFTGMKKGMAYSGIFMTIVYGFNILLNMPGADLLMKTMPLVLGVFFGALVFPLIKTIIETFDGSQAFFERMRYSYRNVVLYARGAIMGFGFAYGISQGIFQQAMGDRVLFGLMFGLIASVGVSIVRDIVYGFQNHGKVQSWKVYFIDSLLGGFIGLALGFYLDSSQVPVIVAKFKLYNQFGFSSKSFTTYPLVSKWGRIDLGSYSGGVKLLFNESLSGVINWAVAAWLFAINRTFLSAFFQKDKAPIKFFFSKAGMVDLSNHMIYVLRWGLWMAPIINTFLRMMAEATWYNQDGAIRTVFAIYHNVTMSSAQFQDWSLKVFISLLAYDFLRVLIWIDHMGLRVATLVNLSFIGMDKLDERVARFIGPSAAQRCIPEAVKRFTTWGPLLLPFYIPRGEAWDYAWGTAEAMQNAASQGGFLAFFQALSVVEKGLFIILVILLFTGISFVIRMAVHKFFKNKKHDFEISNREYKVVVKANGGGYSQLTTSGYDINRPSYDTIEPCGRAFFVVDAAEPSESKKRLWPVLGNFPKDRFEASNIEKIEDTLNIVNSTNGVKTTINISVSEEDASVEIWEVTLENLTDKSRNLKVVPYLEWLLSKSADDRFHTQYSRLFPVMGYARSSNAVLAWQKNTKLMGILASDIAPEGFLTGRVDFIGRAKSLWKPRALETLKFKEPFDTDAYPTFDPIGSLLVGITVSPKASKKVCFMIGSAKDKKTACEFIDKYLHPKAPKDKVQQKKKTVSPLIGHGEILPNTPLPYAKYIDNGNKLLINTPFTPRPWDHAMSNALGHFVVVTNRGLHTTSNGNSQQNRLTPDCPDTVTREIPGEAIYLYDTDGKKWYSPTYHPLNDNKAKYEVEFGVDGTCLYRMKTEDISTDLSVFVPTDETVGVYLLTIKNNTNTNKQIRVAPYFQMVLAGQPEWSGTLGIKYDKKLDALFFENPRNSFRRGPAFVSMSIPIEHVETKRGRFFGEGRGIDRPYMVENAKSDVSQTTDDRPIAGMMGAVEIPANSNRSVVVILGQIDTKKQAEQLIKKYKNIEKAEMTLKETKKWWLSLMKTSAIETNNPEFDYLQNWLKYQAIAERIWARRGFYQSSGAFGFRDQLQDTVNLMWVDPSLARKQIILHASQQFIEGDVVHWFHTLHDGRTAFSNRSHASDNLLWLAWGTAEYVKATGDKSILDEMTSYLKSDLPFLPLPKNKHGWGTIYQRSARQDTVYRHCLKSIDLVLEKRMGKNGLPLIGTGDWNDGLDEIG
ncbi:hypothetical protein KKC59_03080, partial [bacterium]|nr:hypothetical protein [bacterium]